MSSKKKTGLVSLERIFEEILEIEETVQNHSDNPESKIFEQVFSNLEEIRNEIKPLARERDCRELNNVLEEIELAIANSKGDLKIQSILEALESARINLIKYNLRSRKSF